MTIELIAILFSILLCFTIAGASLLFFASQKQTKEIKALTKVSLDVDFLWKRESWRGLSYRQRDLFVSKVLGYVMMPGGDVIAPNGDRLQDVPAFTQDAVKTRELFNSLIKNDDTDLIYYVLYARDTLSRWNGKVDV